MNTVRPIDFSGAAIVCSHVAIDEDPILRAVRDAPVDPADSGWQFTCGRDEHTNDDEAQVWSLNHVVRNDASVREILEAPVGSRMTRREMKSNWEVEGRA